MLFLKVNLHFGTLEEVSAYGKLSFLSINRIYLVFSSLEMPEKLIQTKVYYKLLYSVRKETSRKPLK